MPSFEVTTGEITLREEVEKAIRSMKDAKRQDLMDYQQKHLRHSTIIILIVSQIYVTSFTTVE